MTTPIFQRENKEGEILDEDIVLPHGWTLKANGDLVGPSGALWIEADGEYIPQQLGASDDRQDVFAETADARRVDGPVTGGTTITDLVGSGLEIASGALRVLSSIWDGTSIVADVDNESVSTEEGTINNQLQYGTELRTTFNEQTIADDTAETLVSDGNPKRVTILNDSGGAEMATLLVSFNNLVTEALSNATNQGNSTLSGTTGPDGSINISQDGADLTLENRSGGSLDIVYIIERSGI